MYKNFTLGHYKSYTKRTENSEQVNKSEQLQIQRKSTNNMATFLLQYVMYCNKHSQICHKKQ